MDDDAEVRILLAQPSVGSRASAVVQSAYQGFDWDNGRILLDCTPAVASLPHLAAVQRKAKRYDHLLYLWANEKSVVWPISGKPLSGAPFPKGSTAREMARFMKEDVTAYLGGGPE